MKNRQVMNYLSEQILQTCPLCESKNVEKVEPLEEEKKLVSNSDKLIIFQCFDCNERIAI